jgi:hypothetical protein
MASSKRFVPASIVLVLLLALIATGPARAQ